VPAGKNGRSFKRLVWGVSLGALGVIFCVAAFHLAGNPRVQSRLKWEFKTLSYFSREQIIPVARGAEFKTYELSVSEKDLVDWKPARDSPSMA
jgi:hypothetical protein